MQALIEQAIKFLEGKIRKTPVEYSPKLSKLVGQPIHLKLECLQLTGSFKVRGGFFYLSTEGVAYAGKELHVPCTVFVPKSVDQAKYNKLIALGPHVKKQTLQATMIPLPGQNKKPKTPNSPQGEMSAIQPCKHS